MGDRTSVGEDIVGPENSDPETNRRIQYILEGRQGEIDFLGIVPILKILKQN